MAILAVISQFLWAIITLTDCKFTRELIDQTVSMLDILCILLVMNLFIAHSFFEKRTFLSLFSKPCNSLEQ